MDFFKRLAELALVAFLGAAVPVLVDGSFTKASMSGAMAAGLAAVYGLIAKRVGDPDKPSLAE